MLTITELRDRIEDGKLRCPYCGKIHKAGSLPSGCWTEARIDHVVLCGVGDEHKEDCPLSILKEFRPKGRRLHRKNEVEIDASLEIEESYVEI